MSGLNLPAWTVARNDPKLTGMLSADAQAASGVGATGTPAFLIGDTGGTFQTFQPGTLTSVLPYAAATEQLLRADRRRRLGSPRADRA